LNPLSSLIHADYRGKRVARLAGLEPATQGLGIQFWAIDFFSENPFFPLKTAI
jgi:hypothetical protein